MKEEIKRLKYEIHRYDDALRMANKNIDLLLKKQSDLQSKIDKAIECIKNRNTTKSKKERFMSEETTLEKVLEILGDKENE